MLDSLYCFVIKRHFFNFNTDSRISICPRVQYLRYVEGCKIAFLEF